MINEDKVVFSVPWFKILARNVPGNSEPYYLLKATDYVSVVALTVSGGLLLVRQHRPAVAGTTLELPSGNVERGESPEAAASRELAEETGYGAEDFELLGTLAPDTGRLANNLWCFFARNAKPLEPQVDPEYGIEVVQYEMQEVLGLLKDGSFNNGLHLGVLMLAAVKGRVSLG